MIVAVSTSVTLAARRATKRVPIVFYAADPVSTGLVESFRKPGGRLTGIYSQSGGLAAKRLELLKEMAPRLRRVVAFYRPDSVPAQQSLKVARDAARRLGLELIERPVASVEELRAGLGALRPGEVDALLYVADVMVASQTDLIHRERPGEKAADDAPGARERRPGSLTIPQSALRRADELIE